MSQAAGVLEQAVSELNATAVTSLQRTVTDVTLELSTLVSSIERLEINQSKAQSAATTALAEASSAYSAMASSLSTTLTAASTALTSTLAQHGTYFDAIEDVTLSRFRAFNNSALAVEQRTAAVTEAALNQVVSIEASLDTFTQQTAQLVARLQFLETDASSQLQLATSTLGGLFVDRSNAVSSAGQAFATGVADQLVGLSTETGLASRSLSALESTLLSSQTELTRLHSNFEAATLSSAVTVLSTSTRAAIALDVGQADVTALQAQIDVEQGDQSIALAAFSVGIDLSTESLETILAQVSTGSKDTFDLLATKAGELEATQVSVEAALGPLLEMPSQELSASLSTLARSAASMEANIEQRQQLVISQYAAARVQIESTTLASARESDVLFSIAASATQRLSEQASLRTNLASSATADLEQHVSTLLATHVLESSSQSQELETLVLSTSQRAQQLSQSVSTQAISARLRATSLQQTAATDQLVLAATVSQLQEAGQEGSNAVSKRRSSLTTATESIAQRLDGSSRDQEQLRQTASLANQASLLKLETSLDAAFDRLDLTEASQLVANSREVATFSTQLAAHGSRARRTLGQSEIEARTRISNIVLLGTDQVGSMQNARQRMESVVTSADGLLAELETTLSAETEQRLAQVSASELNLETNALRLHSSATREQELTSEQLGTIALSTADLELATSISKVQLELEIGELSSIAVEKDSAFNSTLVNLTGLLEVLPGNISQAFATHSLELQQDSVELGTLGQTELVSMEQELQGHRKEQAQLARHAVGRVIRVRFLTALNSTTTTTWTESLACHLTAGTFASLAQQVQRLTEQPEAWTVVSSASTITLATVYAARYEYFNQSCLRLHVQCTAGTSAVAAFYSLKSLFGSTVSVPHNPPLGELLSLQQRKLRLTNRLALLANSVRKLQAQAAGTQQELVSLLNVSASTTVPLSNQHELPIYILAASLVLIVLALLLQLSTARRWLRARTGQATFEFSQDDFDDMVAAAVHRTQLSGSSDYEIPLALIRPNTGRDALGRKATATAAGVLSTTESLRVNPIFEVEEDVLDLGQEAAMAKGEYVSVGDQVEE